MDRTRLNGRRGTCPAYGPVATLAWLLLALFLLLFSPSPAAADNAATGTFEERAAAEKMSRSRYRNLEVASLVVILVAGGVAVYWAVRRGKP